MRKELSKENLLVCFAERDKFKGVQAYLQEAINGNQEVFEVINQCFMEVMVENRHTYMAKLIALRFLKELFMTGRMDLIDALNQHIEEHLLIVAHYNPLSKQITKGANYFSEVQKWGKSGDISKASASYVLFSLEIFSAMGRWYPLDEDGEETRFAESYRELKAEAVVFPSEDNPNFLKREDEIKFKNNYQKWIAKMASSSTQKPQPPSGFGGGELGNAENARKGVMKAPLLEDKTLSLNKSAAMSSLEAKMEQSNTIMAQQRQKIEELTSNIESLTLANQEYAKQHALLKTQAETEANNHKSQVQSLSAQLAFSQAQVSKLQNQIQALIKLHQLQENKMNQQIANLTLQLEKSVNQKQEIARTKEKYVDSGVQKCETEASQVPLRSLHTNCSMSDFLSAQQKLKKSKAGEANRRDVHLGGEKKHKSIGRTELSAEKQNMRRLLPTYFNPNKYLKVQNQFSSALSVPMCTDSLLYRPQ